VTVECTAYIRHVKKVQLYELTLSPVSIHGGPEKVAIYRPAL